MSDIGKPERQTQQRVIQLFQNDLGYQYLGDWADRAGNSNIEDGLLTAFLQASGYNTAQASRVLEALHREADNPNRSLMANNQAVYKLLRYGVYQGRGGRDDRDGATDPLAQAGCQPLCHCRRGHTERRP